MNIETWEIVWTVVLILSLGIFAGMSVAVTIGGFGDIKRLLDKANKKPVNEE